MKHLKRFIILAVVLGIGSLLLMRTPATQFRGQDSLELTRHYNSIKAEDINSRAIELYIDDQKFERDDSDKIWMSDNMALMVPGDLVNDLFRCTVAWLDDGKIELTKDKKQWIIDTSRNLIQIDGKWKESDAVEMDDSGNVCLSVNELADYFGYGYQWDDEMNTAKLETPEEDSEPLPA